MVTRTVHAFQLSCNAKHLKINVSKATAVQSKLNVKLYTTCLLPFNIVINYLTFKVLINRRTSLLHYLQIFIQDRSFIVFDFVFIVQ